MPIQFGRRPLKAICTLSLVILPVIAARAQDAQKSLELPEIVVETHRQTPTRPAPAPKPAEQPETNDLASQNTKFDDARNNFSPNFVNTPFNVDRATIDALPQGTEAPIDKVLLQAPGISQDSAASGELHVRNEHANVQYRINGIIVPDGVSGFARVLDTSFIGSLTLIAGALPAQYGLRTAGIVDIQTKSGKSLEQGGSVGIYGGSFSTLTPSLEYGGRIGTTEYFVVGRGFTSNLGIENPTSSLNAIYDRTFQGNFFSYTSTVLDAQTRVATIFGNTTGTYQIPNNPGQSFCCGISSAYGVSEFSSSNLNENQREQNTFGVVALQRSVNGFDGQIAAFSRYSSLHFVPDPIGDILFNGVASNVYRRGFSNGLQGDSAYRLNDAHTLRAGFTASAESSRVGNIATVEPLDSAGNPVDTPFPITDANSKVGWIGGAYVQDEWRINNRLTLNLGLRFDQMWQYVNANQLSPRINLVYKPVDGTTFHAGYARYFTPPVQVIAAPVNIAATANTTAQPENFLQNPVLPERAHYFDVGVAQEITPKFKVSLDAYYKIARDLLDDGQFGQALILSGFNYERGYNEGIELSASYKDGNFSVYGNIAWARQRATNIVSNQYLFGNDELAYIADNYVYTDHAQTWTASAGASYLWQGTKFSASMIYGSGLRSGFANTEHVPPYATANIGVSRDFTIAELGKFTARFDVVNVFDAIYELRDGSGIGVFAPQFGARRGFYVGLSKKL